MPSDRHAPRIVIAGASSLLGNEVKTVLEESRFAGWELRLVDEEWVAGTLTAAGGEATLIQRVQQDTFDGARYAFLTGSADFAKLCLGPARDAGATIIDLSHASLSNPDATPWFPKIQVLTGKSVPRNAKLFSVFSTAGTAMASLALALRPVGLERLVGVMCQPVSEAGREGIGELETQTLQLLSFQSVGQEVFATQVAFNLLPRFGADSPKNLQARLLEIRAEVSSAVSDANEDGKIALNLIHAPVFYGLMFSVCADLQGQADPAALAGMCQQAGFVMVEAGQAAPSNVSVAGESSVFLRIPEGDAAREGSWWFWGAADNLRLPANSACKLVEWLEP
jgi:aspartate-semialdehyde dehydrogenase